jgi:guanine deaminase
MNHDGFLRLAIEAAVRGARAVGGGPFGAIIVRQNQVLATTHNQVTAQNDPTAHAEVLAIRAACRTLGTFQLDGCDAYASCEPCPMCLAALYWARVRAVYFAATRVDAAAAGFDDAHIHDELARPADARALPLARIILPDAGEPFTAWLSSSTRVPY